MTSRTVAALLRHAGRAVDDDVLELWSERAAIRQHDGRMPRWVAEAAALMDVLRQLPRPAPGPRPRPEAVLV